MNKRRRFQIFLYSTPNIVGSALGLLGLGLYFLGVIGPYWLPIVAGLYGIGVLVTPRSQAYELSVKNQMAVRDIRRELDEVVHKAKRRLPREMVVPVLSIQKSILQVLPVILNQSSSDYNIYVIKQTALDYLPATLEAYMNLPKAYVNLHPVKDGKVPRQLLLEQLNLLDQQMKEAVQAIYQRDTEKLMVQGRFLEEKFQKTPPPQ